MARFITVPRQGGRTLHLESDQISHAYQRGKSFVIMMDDKKNHSFDLTDKAQQKHVDQLLKNMVQNGFQPMRSDGGAYLYRPDNIVGYEIHELYGSKFKLSLILKNMPGKIFSAPLIKNELESFKLNLQSTQRNKTWITKTYTSGQYGSTRTETHTIDPKAVSMIRLSSAGRAEIVLSGHVKKLRVEADYDKAMDEADKVATKTNRQYDYMRILAGIEDKMAAEEARKLIQSIMDQNPNLTRLDHVTQAIALDVQTIATIEENEGDTAMTLSLLRPGNNPHKITINTSDAGKNNAILKQIKNSGKKPRRNSHTPNSPPRPSGP